MEDQKLLQEMGIAEEREREREREREKECEFSGKENTLSLNVELSFTN